MGKDLKVLIIPLDWGLGHATRCVPMIAYMLSKGWQITLAGEGKTANLLRREFPQLQILPLRGYRIGYPKKGIFFIPAIIIQFPKIIFSVIYENIWLRRKMQLHGWDIVISDNRYGLFHQKAKTIFITHQIAPISGLGRIVDWLMQLISTHFIQRFNACWVPDAADDPTISGRLSHPRTVPKNITYIGPLSRIKTNNIAEEDFILLLLSGPEPQRTILENKLIEQVSSLQYAFICIRGLPIDQSIPTASNNIHFINHLPADEMANMIARSKMVVCRTGYSTVMDLISLRKKAIVIPTPGQTEQEYLGKRLSNLGWYVVQTQQNLELEKGIKQCIDSQYHIPLFDFETYRKSIDQFGIQHFGA
jgi:uncharacterized protein (TIGR00661 family)